MNAEQLDQLVADYADRLALRAQDDGADLLQRVPAEHRSALERIFRLMRGGQVSAPRAGAALGAGVTLAGYRIERELGRGGMAVVYLATQLDLARKVALKVMRAGLAVEPRHVERFKREALAAARLQHPHIVQVYAVGETDGHHWLAMEYVEGRTLAELYDALPPVPKRTAADLERAAGLPSGSCAGRSFEQALCALLVPVVRALAVTHDLGIVHRDVKPSNILIHRDGRALIADFGLAKGDGDPGVSLTGEPLGTPHYMSPEQATLTVNKVDQRTDVYSFGVTLFEGLAGRRPFDGETVLQVLEALRTNVPPPLRSFNRATTPAAEAVVRRAMARRPDDRYFSAMELAADLQALVSGSATQAQIAEGGRLHRGYRTAVALWRGELGEYKSSTTFLGLPLVHVHLEKSSSSRGRRRVAKGWIAIGDVAVGGCTFGGTTLGVISFGGLSCGLLSMGGVTAGLFAFGGLALGAVACGGVAAGWAAIGGSAWGYYGLGGSVTAVHAVSNEVRDPQALAFFRSWIDSVSWVAGFAALKRVLESD